VNADAFTPPAATAFDFVNQMLPSLFLIFSVRYSKRHYMSAATAWKPTAGGRRRSYSAMRIQAAEPLLLGRPCMGAADGIGDGVVLWAGESFLCVGAPYLPLA